MAFPQVQSITQTTTSGATVHNVSMPATVNAGDLLLMLVIKDGGGNPSTPSGWTNKGGLDASLSVFVKSAAGTEDGGTVAVETGISQNGGFQVYRYSADSWYGDLGDGVEVSSLTGGSGSSPNPPSLDPSAWDAEDTQWLAVAMHFEDTTFSAYPTNYTNGVTTKLSTSGRPLGSARRDLNASSENPGTFTAAASGAWRARTIAIRPALAAFEFEGSAEVSFDGTAAMDVVSDIVFTGSETISFDGVAQTTQVAVFEGSEEVSFDGTAVLSGGSLLLIGEGVISFDGTAVLNQNAVFDGISEVSMNGLIQLGVIQEFAATREVSFDGEATLSVVGWIDVDEPFGPTWSNAT